MNKSKDFLNGEKLVSVLQEGRVVVMPTDTIYGIVGLALNEDTVEKIYTLRDRRPDKPCIVLISDMSELEKFGVSLSITQKEVLHGYWPGPVSVVLPCEREELTYLHRGTNTLAFRVPKDDGLRILISKTGPLIAPSANKEGEKPSGSVEEAKKYFNDEVDMYVDGGYMSGNPSKVIRLSEDGSVSVLRP